jgi:hypothetical protein
MYVQNKWSDLPNAAEPIRSESKRGYETNFVKNRRNGGKIMKKE